MQFQLIRVLTYSLAKNTWNLKQLQRMLMIWIKTMEKKKQKIVEDAEELVYEYNYGHQFQPLSQPTIRSLLGKYIEKMFEVI